MQDTGDEAIGWRSDDPNTRWWQGDFAVAVSPKVASVATTAATSIPKLWRCSSGMGNGAAVHPKVGSNNARLSSLGIVLSIAGIHSD